jgi:hypothetical protein
MKSRLIASHTSILIFTVLLLLPLGSASALPYSEGNSPSYGNGMAVNFNHSQLGPLPFWGEFSFAATDPGIVDSGSIEALPHGWPVTWNNFTFGGTLLGFLNFDPETFRPPGMNALAWLRLDGPADSAPTPVPEPASLLLLGIGLLGFTMIYRKSSQG